MTIILIWCIGQFGIQYEQFISSPRSDTIFADLTNGTYKIADFAHDPSVLWFWRNNADSPEADSLLKQHPLRNNFYLGAVLRWEAGEAETYDLKVRKLHLATHFDSLAVENFLSFIALGLKYRTLQHMRTAISLPVFSDFRTQVFLLTNLWMILCVAIFLCCCVYVIIKMLYYLSAISHRIPLFRHVVPIDYVKALILLMPIIVARDLVFIFICYSVILLLVMDTGEKRWLRVLCIALLLLLALSFPVNNLVSFLNKNNTVYQLYELVHYDTFSNPYVEGTKEKELLAYGIKQRGDPQTALSLYENLYDEGIRSAAVVNNLANLYVLYDEPARAESLYRMSMRAYNRGEPFFNLGLIKQNNLQYLEASSLMEEARKRQVSSLAKEPLDIKPTARDFYPLVFKESADQGLIKTIYIVPLVMILVLSLLPWYLAPPFYCDTCGKPICQSCLKEVGNETLCPQCHAKFEATKKEETEENLRLVIGKGKRRISQFVMYAFNIVLPGAGLLYMRKHFLGILFICPVLASYVPLLFPQLLVKPASWIALPLHSIFIACALLIAFIAYCISFALLGGYHATRR